MTSTRMEEFYDTHFRERNQFIRFEEKAHRYFIFGSSTNVISVTGFIDQVLPSTFDAEWRSNSIVESDDYKSGKSPYSGKTAMEICEIWKLKGAEASNHGTRVHLAAEKALRCIDRGELPETENIPYLPTAFLAFLAHHPSARPLAVEVPLYDANTLMAGTFDFLIEMDNKTVLVDIKTNAKKLDLSQLYRDPSQQKKPFHPCHPYLEQFQNTNITSYMVQLNIYATLMEKYYAIKVDELYVLHLPNHDLASTEYVFLAIPRINVQPLFDQREVDVRRIYRY